MKSNKYEPRVCEICGKLYKPSRIDQRTCASEECTRMRKKLYAHKWYEAGAYRAKKRNHMRKKRDPERYTPKPDTIVAIGYAERQMQQSLEIAGKIKVEL